MTPYKPGEKVPQSGQYVEVGPRGGNASPTEITGVQGDRLPPTSRPGRGWKLVDPTKHKR
ncbi:MAG: YjzC family protein [Propionibacterium sp.]|uniref:YjzC family protein n=1 Tax=uncultured Actinomyces sp. TaxID=249061 RepID=UPI0018113D32|nr:YjzC family protein [uncultured Actinomyces sp.]MBB1585257.1 YjzC family protein [Propionibacterium sp.]